jgi:hypothetical protein
MWQRQIPSCHSRQRIAGLSLGTMNLQTIVKNTSLVENKPAVATPNGGGTFGIRISSNG